MSILIKGMKLPENGYLAIVPTGEVFISGNGWGFQSYGWSVQPDGQAVELPDHGDLVDAQTLDADLRKMMERARKKAEAEGCEEESYFVGRASAFVDARRLLNDWGRAVVIPAERSEE